MYSGSANSDSKCIFWIVSDDSILNFENTEGCIRGAPTSDTITFFARVFVSSLSNPCAFRLQRQLGCVKRIL